MRTLSRSLIVPRACRCYATAPKIIDNPEDFEDVVEELKRRRRKADSKRRQYGATFVDHALVTVRGGKGGSGAAALEASLRGPAAPSGGNGAQGGSVWLTTSPDLSSLATLKKRLIGGQGGTGSGAFRHGRKGEDLIVQVPLGTIVRELKREGEEEKMERDEEAMGLSDEEKRKSRWQRWFITHPSTGGQVSPEEYEEGEALLKKERRWLTHTPSFEESPPIYLDITKPLAEPVLLVAGGSGGLGNPFFPSPRIASRGILPPTHTFEFELKLLADVGLVGFPNTGKSTILRALTGRKAEVADYSFTTLNPQIGVVRVFEDGSWGDRGEEVVETQIERERENKARTEGTGWTHPTPLPRSDKRQLPERLRFTLSDNPGLLPLASQNVGLGHSFLRSIERSPVLAYVLDLTKEAPEEDLDVLKGELEAYREGLSERARVVVLNKGDKVSEEEGKERIENVEKVLAGWDGEFETIVLSGRHGLGMDGLVQALAGRVERAREEKAIQDKERAERGGDGVEDRGVQRVPRSGFGVKK
ncbi:hypothetical protein IAR50_007183 [Cryptococcus sp. DSM 104548]